jgi:hypothetical protein
VFTGDIEPATAYKFMVGGTGLINGTFVAATDGSSSHDTPFTTAGLVGGPDCAAGTTCDKSMGSVPEPTSVVLLATLCL